MGSNIRLIISIWGAAILIYLAVTKASGTSTVLNSFGSFVTGSTKTLQGR
jgi:hypothetical protein